MLSNPAAIQAFSKTLAHGGYLILDLGSIFSILSHLARILLVTPHATPAAKAAIGRPDEWK